MSKKMSKKMIKELSEVFDKWGYRFDDFWSTVNYDGPRGGYEHYHLDDFFEELGKELRCCEYFRYNGKWGRDE